MQAEVLALCHHAPADQAAGNVDVLGGIVRRSLAAFPQIGLVTVLGEADAVGGAHTLTGLALDAERRAEDSLQVAFKAAPSLGDGLLDVEAKLDFRMDIG
jgi:hypothetical protein